MSQNPAETSAESASKPSKKWKELREKSQDLDNLVVSNQETTEVSIEQPLAGKLERQSPENDAGSSPTVDLDAYEQLKKQNATLLEGQRKSQYIIADLHTRLRRTVEQGEKNVQAAVEKTIKKILAGLDALEMSIDLEALSLKEKEGLQSVLQVFYKGLKDLRVQAIDPKPGELFDPHVHSAISTEVPTNINQAVNTVIRVLQKGYKLDERIIRPAMVVVSRADEAK